MIGVKPCPLWNQSALPSKTWRITRSSKNFSIPTLSYCALFFQFNSIYQTFIPRRTRRTSHFSSLLAFLTVVGVGSYDVSFITSLIHDNEDCGCGLILIPSRLLRDFMRKDLNETISECHPVTHHFHHVQDLGKCRR